MMIGVTSKCEIGDSVYFADFYDEWIPSKPYNVSEICVLINIDGMQIIYTICRENDCRRVTDSGCFTNYEDCLKWCEKHNKSSYNFVN